MPPRTALFNALGVHQGKYTSPHVGAADLRVFHGQDQTLGYPNVRIVKELHTFYEFTVKIAIVNFNRIRDGNPVTESQSKIERICSRGFLCGGAPSKSPKITGYGGAKSYGDPKDPKIIPKPRVTGGGIFPVFPAILTSRSDQRFF
jgi:hypothetical protein